MNANIAKSLQIFADNPDPQYAVMLTGPWGCGKTHFIKRWLSKFEKEKDVSNVLQPIYVSLFGMKGTDEITKAINRAISPWFYSQTAETLKRIGRIAGKAVLKTDLKLDNDINVSISSSIDSLSLFQSDDNEIGKYKLIVFDDLERSQIDLKALLGYVNYFVEHCACHVVVVGDIAKIVDTEKHIFEEFQEKTIGRQFEIKPEVNAAIDTFLEELLGHDYLKSQSDFIAECFYATRYSNLRVLRQCLYDFNTQVGLLDCDYGNDNIFLKTMLCSFIAVYAEYNDKGNGKLIRNWNNNVVKATIDDNSEHKKQFANLQKKYEDVSHKVLNWALFPEYVSYVVRHIEKGENLNEYFVENINGNGKKRTINDKLEYFYKYDNDTFNEIYEGVVDDLISGKIDDWTEVGRAIGFLCVIDGCGVRTLECVDQMAGKIAQMIDLVDSKEKLFKVRNYLFTGYNYAVGDCAVNQYATNLIKRLNLKIQDKSWALPDKMQQALLAMTDETVGMLVEIDKESVSDKSRTNQLAPIFEGIDADKLFAQIETLSNAGRDKFIKFLQEHYSIFAECLNPDERYVSDLPVVELLSVNAEEKVQSTESVERYLYQQLAITLQMCIKKINEYKKETGSK